MSAILNTWIPAERLEEATEAVAKINKACERLGTAPWTLTIGRSEVRVTSRGDIETECVVTGKLVTKRALFLEIDITGEQPKLPGGWALIAVVDHTESQPIVKQVPGAGEMPAGQRDRGPLCDHCNTRRSRKDTFVLRDEAGKVVQIGRNCIADFLGAATFRPEYVLAILAGIRTFAGFGDEDADYYGEGGRGAAQLRLDIERVLAITACVIDEDGWVSGARAYAAHGEIESTSSHVAGALWPPTDPRSPVHKDNARYRARLHAGIWAEAKAAIVWARTLPGTSDFEKNISILASQDTCGRDKLGLVVSIIASYRRAQERLRDAERRASATANSQHVGTVKERITIDVTLVATPRAIDGNFGTTYRTEFLDASGNLFVWWASTDCSESGKAWPAGESRTVKATIKRHDEFKGVKQTLVTRVSVQKAVAS